MPTFGTVVGPAGAPNASLEGAITQSVDRGDAAMHQTVLTFTNVTVALSDNAGVVAYGSKKIFDFPAGAITIIGATADLALTKSSAGVNDDWDGDFGMGTAAADSGATLATTEQNVIPTTATPQASSGATTATGYGTAAVYLDGTSTAVDLYLNFLVDDADHDVTGTACNLILNGTCTVTWTNHGDY